MREHNGMRPQDIAILLKIIAIGNSAWQQTDLSKSLHISTSEISESLNRSKEANLIDHSKKNVNRHNLMEFLKYGIKYVFPVKPGSMVRGVPTSHSHPKIKSKIISDVEYVWPYNDGQIIGLAIQPLYNKLVNSIHTDNKFYEFLALLDMIRVGKTREVNYAIEELKKYVLNESSY